MSHTPKGVKYKAWGKDKLSTWSLRRLQGEIDRIRLAKEFNLGHKLRINKAERNIRSYYNPRGPGGIGTGFRNPNRSDAQPSGFPKHRYKDAQLEAQLSGTSLSYNIYRGGGSRTIENYRNTYNTWRNKSEQEEANPTGWFGGGTYQGQPGSTLVSLGGSKAGSGLGGTVPGAMPQQTGNDLSGGYIGQTTPFPSGSGGFGHPSSQGQRDKAAEDAKEAAIATQDKLFADYDTAVEASRGDYASSERQAAKAQSGLGVLGIGDEFWLSRVSAALTQKRAEFAAYRSLPNTLHRVQPEQLESRQENIARSRRSGARGGGSPSRRGPLDTTNPTATGTGTGVL